MNVIKRNYSVLFQNLNKYEGVVKITSSFNASIYLMLVVEIDRLGYENDYDMYEEFLNSKKYRLVPIKHCLGGRLSGFLINLVSDHNVMEDFIEKFMDFVMKKAISYREA